MSSSQHHQPPEENDAPGLPSLPNLPAPVAGLAWKGLLTTAAHPFDLTKTLIQIGHEPLAPRPCKSLVMRKPALGLPSAFQYIGLIRKRDGFFGLYRGLTPRLANLGVLCLVEKKFNEYWPKEEDWNKAEGEGDDENEEIDAGELMTEKAYRRALWRTIQRESALRVAVVLATQPLHVLAVRSMAQFVGRETGKYDGILSGINEVINENGILGFWQGWVPRAIGEISLVCLTTGLTFLVNRYILDDKNLQKYTSHVSGFIASSLVYPFHVVTNCMIVSRSGLAAGLPPRMPLYRGWLDCYNQLSLENQLKRGSSIFLRYYTGPQVVVGSRAIPLNKPIRQLDTDF